MIYEGEVAVMLGASGSGKSTLLNILGGLDTATSGSVRFRGEELTSYSEPQLTSTAAIMSASSSSSTT